MIVIVYWVVENNLVYFAQKRWLICDCDSFLVIFTGWVVIMIPGLLGNNFVTFEGNKGPAVVIYKIT